MTLAEYAYRILLWLYPTKHRQAYGQQMLQHTRDLNREARQRGRWHVAILCLRLLKDGIVNAGIEHMEAIMMGNNRYKPVPWISVLLAALPGVLLAASRRNVEMLAPLLSIIGYIYLGILVLGPLVIWWRNRRFPVWALLPAGALTWVLVYLAGIELSELSSSLPILGPRWIGSDTGTVLLEIILATAIFFVMLRGQHVPGSFWLVIGVFVFGNLVLAALDSLYRYGGDRLLPGMLLYFTLYGVAPLDGLVLAAAGLLAARQHGVLAMLVVVGGFSYMCSDSDYLFGSQYRDWAGLTLYLVAMTALYLVVTPIALLRAKTNLGRTLAVFVPVVGFHVIRIITPSIVIRGPHLVPWGDIILSINVLLSFVIAWVLYSHIGGAAQVLQPDDGFAATPLPT
jgi:hypothetical protein